MDTIDELNLIWKKEDYYTNHQRDVHHDVPAVFYNCLDSIHMPGSAHLILTTKE